jgi:hypothetical protein
VKGMSTIDCFDPNLNEAWDDHALWTRARVMSSLNCSNSNLSGGDGLVLLGHWQTAVPTAPKGIEGRTVIRIRIQETLGIPRLNLPASENAGFLGDGERYHEIAVI